MAKYIAAGFSADAEKLLNEFVEENSFDFSAFARIWKKQGFPAIYMGRDQHEITTFTNEIFQISLGFLHNTSFCFQVGVIYLLYALYRHQISVPLSLIRITFSQFEIFKKVQTVAMENHFSTLHYVTDYLFKNSFLFVAMPTLYGPTGSRFKIDYDKPNCASDSMYKDVKCELIQFRESKVLENLRDLSKEYSNLREKVYSPAVHDTMKDYEKYVNQLESLVTDGIMNSSSCKKESSIGSRRLQLKAKSFSNTALYRQSSDSGEDSESEKMAMHTVINHRRRRRPNRRVGRPSTASLDDLSKNSDCKTENSADEAELPKLYKRRGPKGKITFLESYNEIPALSFMKFSEKKSFERTTLTESEEESTSKETDEEENWYSEEML